MKTSRLPCEDCGSSDALKDYGTHTYCFSCHRRRMKSGYSASKRRVKSLLLDSLDFHKAVEDDGAVSLPDGIDPQFTPDEQLWIVQHGLTQEMEKRYLAGAFHDIIGVRRIIIPVYNEQDVLTGYQARSLIPGDTRKYITKGKVGLFWTKSRAEKPWIVLTEDAISAIRIEGAQTEDRWVTAAALLGLRLKKDDFLTVVKKYSIILIWLDSDAPGHKATIKLANRLQVYGKEVHLQSVTTKEPKQCHNAEIREILKKYFPI